MLKANVRMGMAANTPRLHEKSSRNRSSSSSIVRPKFCVNSAPSERVARTDTDLTRMHTTRNKMPLSASALEYFSAPTVGNNESGNMTSVKMVSSVSTSLSSTRGQCCVRYTVLTNEPGVNVPRRVPQRSFQRLRQCFWSRRP